MKNKIIVIIFLWIGNMAFAQNLTLNQLIQVSEKNFSNAEEYLVSKNWDFLKAYLPNQDILGYGKNTHMSAQFGSSKSSLFIYTDDNQPTFTRIFISWDNKIKYNEYIASLKTNGYKLFKSKVNEHNQIVKIYKNNSKIIQITTSVSYKFNGDQFPSWQMLILKNKDFEINF